MRGSCGQRATGSSVWLELRKPGGGDGGGEEMGL